MADRQTGAFPFLHGTIPVPSPPSLYPFSAPFIILCPRDPNLLKPFRVCKRSHTSPRIPRGICSERQFADGHLRWQYRPEGCIDPLEETRKL